MIKVGTRIQLSSPGNTKEIIIEPSTTMFPDRVVYIDMGSEYAWLTQEETQALIGALMPYAN